MTRRPHPILLITALVSIMLADPVAGQEELRPDRKVERYRNASGTMSESVYRRLGNIQENLAADKFDEVIDALRRLQNSSLNDYEEALVFQTFGFAYIQKDELRQAIEYFEKSLALESLPGEAQQGMLYSLASLYAAEGEYRRSIDTMRTWFRYEANPVPDAYLIIATSFVELQQFADALPYVQKAIEIADEPREQWYMLELAIYFEQEQFRNAAELLKKMLGYWPGNGKYWDMLASCYLELGQDKSALDAMMVAYGNGLVEDKTRLMTVVQLNLSQNIPFAAGSILESEMAAGRLDENSKNLEILLQAWISAKEYERAARIIDRLGEFVDDGEIFMRKAGIHNELGNWTEVIRAVEQALARGLEEPAEAHTLAGMAHAELRQYDEAIAAFRRVQTTGDEKQRRNAGEWIAYVREQSTLKLTSAN